MMPDQPANPGRQSTHHDVFDGIPDEVESDTPNMLHQPIHRLGHRSGHLSG